MASGAIIDSLVVELGLDPQRFTQGQREALDSLRKMEEGAVSRSKNVERSAQSMGQALTTVKNQALGMLAVFMGGKGMIDFATGVGSADAAIGRMSRNIGVSEGEISSWGGMARTVGGDARTMAGQFKTLSDAIEGFKRGQSTQLIPDLVAVFSAAGMAFDKEATVQETYLQLADALKIIREREGAAGAGFWQTRLGLDPGTFELLIKGRTEVEKLQGEMRTLGVTSRESAAAAAALNAEYEKSVIVLEGVGRSAIVAFVEPLKAALGLIKNIKAEQQKQEKAERENVEAGGVPSPPGFFKTLFKPKEAQEELNRHLIAKRKAELEQGSSEPPSFYDAGMFPPKTTESIKARYQRFMRNLFETEILAADPRSRTSGAEPGDVWTETPTKRPTPGPQAAPGASSLLRVKPGAGGAGTFSETTRQLAEELQAAIPALKEFTAANDTYHAFLGGSHPKGRALDFTLKDPAQHEQVSAMIRDSLKRRGVNATVLDEYDPTKRGPSTTAPHIHIQINTPEAATRYRQSIEKGTAPGAINDNRQSSNTTTQTTVNVARVDVHTQATDGPGIADAFRETMELTSMASPANVAV